MSNDIRALTNHDDTLVLGTDKSRNFTSENRYKRSMGRN